MQTSTEGSRSPSESRRASTLSRLAGTFAPLSFLLFLAAFLWLIEPRFGTRDNLKQIAIQSAVVAILACGQTAVIISGNIDLSVGNVMAFSGVAAAQAMVVYHFGVAGGVAVACVCGLLLGLLNGVLTAYGRIPSFIVTLGMMGIAQGTAGILSKSQNIGNLPEGYSVFGFGELLGTANRDGIPYALLMMMAAAILVHIGLSRTQWGRSIYAMGGNREAARLSGVRLNRVLIGVFALSGLLAGFASVITIARASVASMNAGEGYELYAVAATVIGGTSLFGGQGGVPGTILGAFLIFTIRNGCDLRGIGPEYQKVIIGTVVILAVLYDRFSATRKNRQ